MQRKKYRQMGLKNKKKTQKEIDQTLAVLTILLSVFLMVADGGDHVIRRINVESLCRTPETNIILYANYNFKSVSTSYIRVLGLGLFSSSAFS